jgi:hypothetical protein
MEYITRSFTKISVEDFIVTKTSTNVDKLKSEYAYYQEIPETYHIFFAVGRDFKEGLDSCSYIMNLIPGNDFGHHYAHDTLTYNMVQGLFPRIDEFKSQTYTEIELPMLFSKSHDLIVNKAKARSEELSILSSGKYDTLTEDYVARIRKAFESLFMKERKTFRTVLSHGDLCFSNILEDTTFIDPRGVESMHLDEYYDLAKLSQSILGGYDFIVHGKDIAIDEELKDIFISFLEEKEICYDLLRLYEASLFLSMCPIHYENTSHVDQFLTRAGEILTEIGH